MYHHTWAFYGFMLSKKLYLRAGYAGGATIQFSPCMLLSEQSLFDCYLSIWTNLSHGWKYCSLIYRERKTLLADRKSMALSLFLVSFVMSSKAFSWSTLISEIKEKSWKVFWTIQWSKCMCCNLESDLWHEFVNRICDEIQRVDTSVPCYLAWVASMSTVASCSE